MFHRHETDGSGSDDRSSDAPAIDLNRLRAALRLIFNRETVDHIVSAAGSGSIELTIKRVMRSIAWEWRVLKIRRRLRRSAEPETERPLGLGSGASARGAAALALHLGLNLPLETIAQATSVGAGQLGTDLYQTRLQLEPRINPACGQFVSSVGRYRDGSLDIAARATLIQHAHHCAACRNALERFQTLDAQLLEAIELERVTLPVLAEPAASRKLTSYRQSLLLATAVLLVVVILGASGYAIERERRHMVDTVASGPMLSGWVLTSDVAGNVTALNLATGIQRPLFEKEGSDRYPGYRPASTALSPDGTLIASQTPSTTQTLYQELVIKTLNGNEMGRVRLSDPNIRFSGWLGNDAILEVSAPLYEEGESQEDYNRRAQTESSLVAVNIKTGRQNTLLTGAVEDVYASPNGAMIAVLSSFTQNGSNWRTLELRRVENERVSGFIASPARLAASDPVWSPDSSHVFLATVDAPPSTTTVTPDIFASPTPTPLQTTELVSIARDGTIQPLPLPPESARSVPLTVSPDGTRLIVEAVRRTGVSTQMRVAELTLSNLTYRWLGDWDSYQLGSPVWSPDGSTMLGLEYRPFLVPPTDRTIYSSVPVNRLIAYQPDGERFSPLTRMSGEIGQQLFAWLPDDVLPESTGNPLPVRLTQPQAVALSEKGARIDTTAQVSRTDDYVVLYDPEDKHPVIWDRVNNDSRVLPAGTHDLSWFPRTAAVIGVGTTDAGRTDAPSRLATYAPTFTVGPPVYDYQLYDPAEIGASHNRQYEAPQMSPSENALAFFTFETRNRSVTLWLATYEVPAKPIEHWFLPNDNKLSYEPIAGWTDNQTLLFAVPDDWRNGLPGEVKLNRLVVQPDGSAHIETATTLKRHGTERGIAIDELAINQASEHIAYRLRHFTKNSTNDGIVDTLAIASTNNLSDALEISRGGSSSGLSWSPDGRLLAATTPDALEFYSGSGEALFGISDLDFPNEPRWIDENTVWFNESNDHGTRIMSVDLQ
jgi:hypothetical protein